MNKNVEPVCGKIQSKGKEGLRGMSLPDIEKLIMATVKGTNKEGEFKRYKTSIPKGESKRLRYCAFIKENLKNEWNKYNKGKKPANAPKRGPAPVPKAIREMLGGEEFAFEEEAMEMGNVNNSNEREGGNYGNGSNNEGRMVFQPTTFARGARGGNKDPLKGSKPSKRLLKQVETMLRRMKRQGKAIPELKTQENMMKFAMLKKPSNFLKPRGGIAKKSRDPRARVRRMALPKGVSTVATGRVLKGPSMATAIPGTKLSMPEIRKASNRANALTDKLMKVGQNRNFMREVLRSNAPADANRLANNLSALEKFNRNSVRGVIRTYEMNRAKVLKNIGAPIAKAPAKNLPSGAGFIVPKSLAELAKNARNKKAAERTPEEKRALKAMERLAKMKTAGKRRFKPEGMEVMASTRPLDLGSNKNSNSNSNTSSVRSVRSVRMMGSNSNSNSNSGVNLNQPIVQIEGSKVMVNRTNVNQMNRRRLQNAARRILAVVRPGTETSLWLNATNDELRRLVKGSAKKMTAKSK